jgi:hypothetical protein
MQSAPIETKEDALAALSWATDMTNLDGCALVLWRRAIKFLRQPRRSGALLSDRI